MEESLLNFVNGVPVAAAVLYIWIISNKNNREDMKSWRETVEKKDAAMEEMKQCISELATQVKTLTFVIQNYVTTNRKNPAGKQGQRP